MKTIHVVLAACAALPACSQEPAKEAPAVPKPITTADTGGRDLALKDVMLRLSAPMPVTWAGTGESAGTVRTSTFEGTVLNATDADIVNPSMTCIIGDGPHAVGTSQLLKGTVPAHGQLTVTLDHFDGADLGRKVVCGVEAVFDQSRMMSRDLDERMKPLPGSSRRRWSRPNPRPSRATPPQSTAPDRRPNVALPLKG